MPNIKRLIELEQETRLFDFDTFDTLDIRAEGEGDSRKIVGHGTPFNKLSQDLGGFREMFIPGAFTETIQKQDIRSLFNHTPSYILGRNKAGTLSLSEDEKGLYYEVTPPDTSYARDLMVSIGRRDVTGCSIIFRVDGKSGQRWMVDGKETDIRGVMDAMWSDKKHNIERHVLKAELREVGPVTFPAYTQTDVKVRDYLSALKEAGEELDSEAACERAVTSLANLKWKLR
jgi:hypothetical protein